MKYARIYLMGGPGSGKSYAAKKLSKISGFPFFDLDKIYWHPDGSGYTRKTSEKERDKKFKSILKKKEWIVDGVYSSWTAEGFEKADIIIILRPNRYLRAVRILKRSLYSRLGLSKRKSESLKSLKELMKWNHFWDVEDIVKVQKILDKYKRKVKYFKSADKAMEFLKSRI